MAKMGRKSMIEELQVLRRYSELTEPAFKFIRECLEGDNKADKKWAVERLEKGWVKAIPQMVIGDEDQPLTVKLIAYGNNDTLQVPTEGIPTAIPESDGQREEASSNSVASPVGEGQNPDKLHSEENS